LNDLRNAAPTPGGSLDNASTAGPDGGRPGPRPGVATVILLLVMILAATAVSYSPVLFNFFAGDDFVHLTWLKDAIKNHELIWRNFHSSWLDGTTTRFYRPLISVFMVSDYALWGLDGLGFHLTNLLCHLASTTLLFLIVRRLAGDGEPGATRWALVSAALFGLYPLHPEAVSWITGRVDSIVTMFCLASLWSYMRWRAGGGWPALAASLLAMALGLASKEMAVTLPPLFACYELTVNSSRTAPAGGRSWKRLALAVAAATAPFWILLGAYFLVRRLALGTFVGGYDDSLFFVSNFKLFLGGWVHGIRMLLVPLNKDLMGAHHLVTRVWEVALAASIAGTVAVSVLRSRMRPALAFACLWLVLSLVPVYKIFAIADDLQGSRLAYLATVPLAVLLSAAAALAGMPAAGPFARRLGRAASAAAIVLVVTAGIALFMNNQAWRQAGMTSNAIRAALADLYRELPGDPQVLVIGLPDNIHGAYTCRNALWGMTKSPQLFRDVKNCLMLDRFEPILPFGHMKRSILEARDDVHIYRWAEAARKFLPVTLSDTAPANADAQPGESAPPLKAMLSPLDKKATSFTWLPDGSLAARGGDGVAGRPEALVNTGATPAFAIDFVAVQVAGAGPGANGKAGFDLLYSNDLSPDYDLARRAHCDLPDGKSDGTLIFPLRGLPEWSLGGRSRGLKLCLPDRSDLVIKRVSVVSAQDLVPRLDFDHSGVLGSKGFIHLSTAEPGKELRFDVSRIAGAERASLAITRPNILFESQNPEREGRVTMKRIELGTRDGIIRLERGMFPSAGVYQVRLWALDGNGRTRGVGSDHLVVSVDS